MTQLTAINLLFFILGMLTILLFSKFIPAVVQWYWKYQDWKRRPYEKSKNF